ncbi:MAG: tRNA 2-thiouridine(34) synthase MnmA [Treponema sp.]|nr:MAG: tRNA 2-thiouridine(34) synthase MnmA [Treponema sp.]
MNANNKTKVLVGLSGGVDSAVSAKLLLQKGYNVAAVTLNLLSDNAQEADIKAAKLTADSLGIKHFVYDAKDEFKKFVIDYFVESYESGLTPNPCFLCNNLIKFGLMQEYAFKKGFNFIASGHYAKITYDKTGDIFRLYKGKDKHKDQSYFLAGLTQAQLSKTIFPLADLTKSEVRQIAKSYNLPCFEKTESQDICFVHNNDYTLLIDKIAKDKFREGSFILSDGKVVGKHAGLHRYTIGQRRGLNLAFGYPVYVIKKSSKDNTVTVGKDTELFCSELFAKDINIIANDVFKQITDRNKNSNLECLIKTRYKQVPKLGTVLSMQNNIVHIKFNEPERAVAPGQVVVLYMNEQVIASGIIGK